MTGSDHARGQWIVVPRNLAEWERDLRAATTLDPDTRRILLAVAHLTRRAMLRDGKRVGERFWIGADELAATADRMGVS